jgi:hypothetical protein
MSAIRQATVNGTWTIRNAADVPRAGVTDKTVKDLAREKATRGVARIAKKYAK